MGTVQIYLRSFTLRQLYLRRIPGTSLARVWVCLTAGLDVLDKRKCLPLSGIESRFHRRLACDLVTILTELSELSNNEEFLSLRTSLGNVWVTE